MVGGGVTHKYVGLYILQVIILHESVDLRFRRNVTEMFNLSYLCNFFMWFNFVFDNISVIF